jgi:hypothetical protein
MVQADVLDKDIMAHLRGKRKGKRRGNEKISASAPGFLLNLYQIAAPA